MTNTIRYELSDLLKQLANPADLFFFFLLSFSHLHIFSSLALYLASITLKSS